MQATIHHLTTTQKFWDKANQSSDLVIHQFVEGCKKLDASIIEKVINEDDVFENKSKYKFLADLKRLFDHIKGNKGHLKVTVSDDSCQGCSFGKPIKVFSVKEIRSGINVCQFAFVIDLKYEILKDIYQCNLFHK